MRRPHLLRPNHRTIYPVHAIWLDTETVPEPGRNGEERHVLAFGWACYRRRLRGWRWSAPRWHRFTTPDAFWRWALGHAHNRSRLHLYAHNAAFDLTVLRAWDRLPQAGFRLTTAVLDAPPFVAHWRRGEQKLVALDTLNVWRVPLAQLGAHVGLPKSERPLTWNDRAAADRYCRRDVDIIMRACLEWWSYLRKHDLGSAAPTIAAQALTAYRHRFLTEKILLDDNAAALELARAGYHGGRVEAYRLGHLPGPLYLLDVRAMYPAVMARELFPRWLHSRYTRVSVAELAELCGGFAVLADVTIETDTPAYPYRVRSPLLFPIGRFRTVLTTPELRHALTHGHVRRVHAVTVYDAAWLFHDYVHELYRLRCAARAAGDRVADWTTKLLMNSLFGKFGQRGWRYRTVGESGDLTPKVWDEYDHTTGRRYRMRQLGGVVQEHWQEGEAKHSHPAIAAHVTAYARLALWTLMSQAGRRHVFYVDTDSLLVDAAGHAALADRIGGDALGTLHLEAVADRARIMGPKDYSFGPTLHVKGVRASATWLDDHTVQQEKWLGLRSLLWRGDLSAPIVRQETRALERRYTKGAVLLSGRTRPWRLPDEDGRWDR